MDKDIIYIILFIVISIIGSISQNAKKAKERKRQLDQRREEESYDFEENDYSPQPTVTETQRKYFEDPFKRIITNQSDDPYSDSFDDEFEEQDSKSDSEYYDSFKDELAKKEQERAAKIAEAESLKKLSEQFENFEDEVDESESDFQFDPKEAIIYSEILKRPDF